MTRLGFARCGLSRPFELDGSDLVRIASAVQAPAPKCGLEAINEWRKFCLAARKDRRAPLQLTALGATLSFLLDTVTVAGLAKRADRIELLVSDLDAASRPHIGSHDNWQLVLPLDNYPEFLHLTDAGTTPLKQNEALLIAPRTVSAAGHFGADQAYHLLLSIPAAAVSDSELREGLTESASAWVDRRRTFGAEQRRAVGQLHHITSRTNFDRIFDLLCMLPFDFELDIGAPFAFIEEIAQATGRPHLCKRAAGFRRLLLAQHRQAMVDA